MNLDGKKAVVTGGGRGIGAACAERLAAAGATVADLDAVAYYEDPVVKLSRQLWAGMPSVPELASGGAVGSGTSAAWLDPRRPEEILRHRLGFETPFETVPHHLAHAASAFEFSGFEDAATLTVDGVGEWATTTYGTAGADGVALFDADGALEKRFGVADLPYHVLLDREGNVLWQGDEANDATVAALRERLR